MKNPVLSLFVIIFLLAVSCSGPKNAVAPADLGKALAEQAAASGDYVKAIESWTQYFNATSIEKVAGSDFAQAAKSAFKAGNITQSVSWFDQARYKNYSSEEMYLTLAEIYRRQQNISKELLALEYIQANYPIEMNTISKRLFDIYTEIKEPEKALGIWKQLSASQQGELPFMTGYFELQKGLKDTLVCDSVSLVLLKKDPQNVPALEWNAFKYYWKGENRYQSEMDKYNRNKTNKQYKLLIDELAKSTGDFKKSLVYLEKLWAIEPGKKYAAYFANIYARFGDGAKAKSYDKYLK